MPVPQSVDFLLYKNDPNAPMIMFKPEKYRADEFAWSVSAEVDALGQHLKNFDVSGQMSDQGAYAAALQAVVGVGYWRLSATGIVRDLNYVVRNVPGSFRSRRCPKMRRPIPRCSARSSASYYLPIVPPHPGNWRRHPAPERLPERVHGRRCPRVQNRRRPLAGERVDPAVRRAAHPNRPGAPEPPLGYLLDPLGRGFWIQYIRDNNGTLVVTDPTEGTASLLVFQSPNQLGAAVSLQARY